DEVPPHDDVLPQWFTAQEHQPQRLLGPGVNLEVVRTVGDDDQVRALGGALLIAAAQACRAAIDQHPVLMGGIEVDGQAPAGFEVYLGHLEGVIGDHRAGVGQVPSRV